MSFDFLHSLRLPRLAVAALLLTAAACDNPVGEEHEDHPIGFVVLNAQGQELARFNGAAVNGQLILARNSSATFTVAALSEDGDRIDIDGTELELRVTVEDGVATAVVQQQNQVVVTGTQAGTGGLRIAVFHEGHEDFARAVVLVVT